MSYPFILSAHPGDRAVYGVGLRPLTSWDRGFESRSGYRCQSLVSVVCCQGDVFAILTFGTLHYHQDLKLTGTPTYKKNYTYMNKHK